MEEKMCQQRKSISKHTQTKYLYQQSQHHQASGFHQCKMCSSFSSFASSSSSLSSSASSSSSSCSLSSTIKDIHHRQSADKKNNNGCFIRQHWQSMFSLLRREETLKMAVRLESAHSSRTRYLVVVCRIGKSQQEECCLLGMDCNKRTTVGLVLKVLADTAITLDGDGGFSVSVCGRQHVFKPVSVQAMWSALQTLYKVSMKARECNYFEGGNSHEWVSYYEQSIESDRSCLNEWHTMNDIESRRPPSPDSLRSKPRERLETERIIRFTLKEIMMSVDLDEVTSKYIRSRLEEQLDVDLREFKSFIDQEMLVILGQMDAATEIFPHVYLGSEWNASNLEELNKNGICHILNVTREIDNFFPGTFDYLNIRVYDDNNTNLLKHWDNTYKYINKVKKENSKVLVHCKMGISRSASVVIAYAMKAYNWDFKKAFEYVQKKRSCIKPNHNFINQLETYQGMLDAMKNKEKLQRSKSETNLKSGVSKRRFHAYSKKKREEHATHTESANNENQKTAPSENYYPMLRINSGIELAQLSMRPKSWSPDNMIVSEVFSSTGMMSQSLEQLNVCKFSNDSHSSSASSLNISPPRIPPAPPLPPLDSRYNLSVRMPCENGLTYSVSQNKIVQLYSAQNSQSTSVEEQEALESYTHDSETLKDVPSSNVFVLQMPSQFQSSLLTFSKKNNLNLVMKNLPLSGDKDDVKSQPPLSTPFKGKENSLLVSATEPKTKRSFTKKKDFLDFGVRTISCYQNECQNISWRVEETNPIGVFDANERHGSGDSRNASLCATNTFNNNDQSIKTISQPTNQSSEGISSSVINTVQLLERLTQSQSNRFNVGIEKEDEKSKGIVQNLKKEFEAKCNVFDKNKQKKRCSFHGDTNNNNNDDVRILPCSVQKSAQNRLETAEDLSVRKLVGKYEVAKGSKERSKNEKKLQPPIPPRKSSLDVNLGPSKLVSRPGLQMSNRTSKGMTPIVRSLLPKSNEIKATVSKATNMLQQSKQYPLAKFAFSRQKSSSSSVYNTV